jgi:hypothetical protein
MHKEDFVSILKAYRKTGAELNDACAKVAGRQIQAKAILASLESFATTWFNTIDPTLRTAFALDDAILGKYRESLESLLVAVGGHPTKITVRSHLAAVLDEFHTDILVPVQKREAVLARYPSLSVLLDHAQGLELEYLSEAIDCARLDKRRASIILGWCAAVNRLHLYVEKVGFEKFNEASAAMWAIKSGRYKRFDKKFNILNLSDLRMSVFDDDLLWVLEYMQAIDGNQHDRLGICFTMRNTSAHPGDAILTDENVLSFFSDIDSMVFNNPKFSI